MTLPALGKLTRSLLALLMFVAATTAVAQERPRRQGPPEQQQAAGEGVLRLLPPDSVTEHTIDLPSGKLSYTATAGTLSLFDQSGERSAAIFYTAYVVESAEPAKRPLTFVFNGGPGAASAYLHLGLVGPRVAEFGPDNRDATALRLQDNPDTWLPFTDLVLLDPVGSGWSKPAKADGGSAFWGVRRDADSLAKTIALYISKNARSASPKFILGESYGGFRAAKVAQALRRDQGIAVAGIVMVSPLLEGAFTFGGTRFALGAALQLPSLAAQRISRHTCRPAAAGRGGARLLCARRRDDWAA
jgi:carboxypeptidase C (cathepsin A)